MAVVVVAVPSGGVDVRVHGLCLTNRLPSSDGPEGSSREPETNEINEMNEINGQGKGVRE